MSMILRNCLAFRLAKVALDVWSVLFDSLPLYLRVAYRRWQIRVYSFYMACLFTVKAQFCL